MMLIGRKSLSTKLFMTAVVGLLLIGRSGWEVNDIVSSVLLCAGSGLVFLGMWGRAWTSLYLIGYSKERLVTLGPYSLCRNPLYFSTFVGVMGLGLDTETITVPITMLLGFVLYYPFVIRKEERVLKRLHGDDYADYCRRTPAFLPNWRRLREPETYTVFPDAFRRNFKDYGWFVLALGLIELCESLHETGALPALLTLY